MEQILIIKHGALGDFVQSLGAMASIRLHHPKAKITLLTTKPMESL
ncbi:MAG: glycosyltransferase family 9 protein, partial [Dongiaceae bacterium]